MPNHVSHIAKVSGDPEKLKEFIKLSGLDGSRSEQGKSEKEVLFDFGGAVPKPEILDKVVSSTTTDIGLAYFGYKSEHGDDSLYDYLEREKYKKAGCKTVDDVARHIEKHDPECIEMGKLAIKAYAETGHYNWYTWSNANWGTKWGAYNVSVSNQSDTKIEFHFDTAWSPGYPVYEKYAELFPELSFTIYYIDEGMGFGGTWEAYDGEGYEHDADDLRTFSQDVFGWEPYEDDEEEVV